ncbi:MAG: porin [Sulfuritalea sp.]|nr:porin [Sulfuritalea sp.]
MQKKLIALAIAGIVAAPAFAADNVTIYGVAGAYLQSMKTDVTTTATGATVNTSVSQVQTDGESGSRIGFKGTEDLGGGLKANFVVESSYAIDTAGDVSSSGAIGLGNRQAYVGLSGNWGAVNLGRQYSSEFYHMAVREVWGYADWSALLGAGMAADTRISNSISYTSPSFSGFSGRLHYGFSEGTVAPKNAGQTTGLNLDYANGPLWVGYGYLTKNVDTAAAAAVNGSCINNTTGVWSATVGAACPAGNTSLVAGSAAVAAASGSNTWNSLGASYDFGMAKVSGSWQTRKAGIGGAKKNSWQLGANFKAGANGAVIVQFAQTNDKAVADTDAKAWALGYQHTMSKRTNLVVGASSVDQSGAAATTTDTRKYFGGIRHTF